MGEKKHEKNGAIPLDEYKTDREQLTEELTALKASERRRLWRSVIKEIRMDAGKNLDIIFL